MKAERIEQAAKRKKLAQRRAEAKDRENERRAFADYADYTDCADEGYRDESIKT
jgi:hypothetical protein